MAKFIYEYIIGIGIGIIFLITSNNTIAAPDQNNTTTIAERQNQFNPIPFNEIPLVVVNYTYGPYINYTYGQYKFGADFSLERNFGDETVIEQDISATAVPNMRLDEDNTNLYLDLQCDSNDICDTSLAPESISIYLVDDTIQDIHIAENSVPKLQLGSKNCDGFSIEDCANFYFSISGNIIYGNYKIIVEISFDEAEWIFINPVEIVHSIYPGNSNVTVRCDDLAIDLISWDLLIGGTDEPTRTNIEDILGDENVSPALITEIINPHLERLLSETKDKCNNLDENIKRVLEGANFEFLP